MNYPKETPKENKHDGTKLTNYSTWNTRRIRIVIRGGLRGLIDISYDECDKHREEDAGLQGHLGSMWCDSSASYKSLISLSPEQSLTCNSSAPLVVSHPDLYESCTFRVVELRGSIRRELHRGGYPVSYGRAQDTIGIHHVLSVPDLAISNATLSIVQAAK